MEWVGFAWNGLVKGHDEGIVLGLLSFGRQHGLCFGDSSLMGIHLLSPGSMASHWAIKFVYI